MNSSNFNVFSKKDFLEECKTFFSAALITLMVFGGTYAYDAYAATQQNTLTVTISAATTFTVTTNSFGTITPGTPLIATSTINVVSNDYGNGWNVTLSGDNKGTTTASTTLYIAADTATVNKIPDATQWVPGAATTSAGNSTTISSGVDLLYFRVMTASGSVPFRSTTWWGTDDTPFTNAKWAGVASSTNSRKIGSVASNDLTASSTINTVQYYLDVAATQQNGSYTGGLTFTWTNAP